MYEGGNKNIAGENLSHCMYCTLHFAVRQAGRKEGNPPTIYHRIIDKYHAKQTIHQSLKMHL